MSACAAAADRNGDRAGAAAALMRTVAVAVEPNAFSVPEPMPSINALAALAVRKVSRVGAEAAFTRTLPALVVVKALGTAEAVALTRTFATEAEVKALSVPEPTPLTRAFEADALRKVPMLGEAVAVMLPLTDAPATALGCQCQFTCRP
jgi:hypothetical protein